MAGYDVEFVFRLCQAQPINLEILAIKNVTINVLPNVIKTFMAAHL